MMLRFFLLALITWLRGYLGTGGFVFLLFFFIVNAYSVRYRGYYGRRALAKEEDTGALRLESEVDKKQMRSQWDVIPWPGTAKHVIRKWTWDRIALDTRIQRDMVATGESLTRASRALSDWIDNKVASTSKNPYAGTLAVIDDAHQWSHTPKSALALLNKVSGGYRNWDDKALCTLGGTFVVCGEAYKAPVKARIEKEKGKKEPRMKSGTVAETSRLTWKLGQVVLNFGWRSFDAFLRALFARINPLDQHAVIQYRQGAYYAPTTMFGASATIMKVMNLCEALDLSDDDKEFVGYCVALHWIDKYLNDNSWFNGGWATPDRHSLIEALQGMYAHINDDPTKAARELALMYEQADEARKSKKRD
ncbi:hypothetical protein [Corallococcus exercitus]|uniref:Uncharacterized protein n=1 Tax=Corallococcus exercitus TaxID=2316736 RepID=A0A7Y4JPG6_9BACT|nr:hypothetical protein [Corallococcus exercitus]NOK08760.1 hypothetical protein [Corallococcus exercitus]